MYIYIAYLPCRCCYCDLSFANLLIANIDSFSDLDDLVYTIPAPTPAKPAKITLAEHCTAAYKAKQRKLAKACTTAEGLRRSKRTTGGNTGRYTINSGLTANKDDNDAYNRAYIPPADAEEEEEDSSGNNDGVNGSTSNSTDKGKSSSAHEHSESALRCKDILLYKQ
ncbi:hypothetical protein P8C59_005161 [Phyllachora maydis]|uniref:Uncharacterized protein n=1 Tax=Phyllachora maydis TaxID=1825666 RepID=A0AAD9I3R7_9PEZI|nr:hypothetical protein P8C59_005161 [Phyllachora maydis]